MTFVDAVLKQNGLNREDLVLFLEREGLGQKPQIEGGSLHGHKSKDTTH